MSNIIISHIFFMVICLSFSCIGMCCPIYFKRTSSTIQLPCSCEHEKEETQVGEIKVAAPAAVGAPVHTDETIGANGFCCSPQDNSSPAFSDQVTE
jgi:hypothetical protein